MRRGVGEEELDIISVFGEAPLLCYVFVAKFSVLYSFFAYIFYSLIPYRLYIFSSFFFLMYTNYIVYQEAPLKSKISNGKLKSS